MGWQIKLTSVLRAPHDELTSASPAAGATHQLRLKHLH